MQITYFIIPAIILAIVSFATGLAPVGIGLIVIAAGLAGFQRLQGGPSAQRAKRIEERDPTDPLPPAHEGQAHMTPDTIDPR